MSNSMDVRTEHDVAWAAGIFDGEGSTSTYLTKPNNIPRRQMAVSQGGVPGQKPSVLLRFKEIVRVGSVTGPRIVPSPWSRLPQYRWQANGRHVCSAAIKVIWPWLGPVKRAEIRAAMEHLDTGVEDWMR